MSKEREVEICNVAGSLKGWGGEKKRWSLHQIETWAEREREFEICNVEGSLKGGKKEKEKEKRWSLQVLHEKTESLKATHLLALPFLRNGCLSDFLPPFIPFHTFYKYWQNLPALVEVSLHLNFFLGAKLLCSVYINMRPFFFFVCLCLCLY